MSVQQLDDAIRDVQAIFVNWGQNSTLPDMRRVTLGGAPAERVVAPGIVSSRAVLYFHGGGYVFGSPNSHRDLTEHLSQAAQAEVFILDYRLAPEHPFPAAVEDALAAYRALLAKKPAVRLVIAGDSAGGGLTFATLMSLRDAGIALPACAVTFSPWTDLEGTGASMLSKADVDPVVSKEVASNIAPLHVPSGDLRTPLASPIYGDLSGLPPILVQVGERECLLDDSVRIVEGGKAAGVPIEFGVWNGQIHFWQIFASRLGEGAQALDRAGGFIRQHVHWKKDCAGIEREGTGPAVWGDRLIATGLAWNAACRDWTG